MSNSSRNGYLLKQSLDHLGDVQSLNLETRDGG